MATSVEARERLAREGILPLPPEVEKLLAQIDLSDRLLAYLSLVHDTSVRLCEALCGRWEQLAYVKEPVAFGAATHDIGKAIFFSELNGPGHRHEQKGEELLLELGVEEKLARFARTHANWRQCERLEDLLVALSDHIWRGARVERLEEKVATAIAYRVGADYWQVYRFLTDLLERLSQKSSQRVVLEASFPIR